MPAPQRLVVSSSVYETRAALLEDGVVVELFVERARDRGIVGNIYKGRVRKVLPGMQSAFVDIGLAKDSFLYVSDIATPADERWLPGDGIDPGEAAAVDVAPVAGAAIEHLLAEGEEVIVQVVKEPIAGKGARITTHVTLPGRYVVYMPTLRQAGVSRRIEGEAERQRLKDVAQRLRDANGAGYIIRTAGEGRSNEEFAGDAAALAGLWQSLTETVRAARPPQLVHEEPSLLGRLLRDVVTGDLIEMVVDHEADYRRAVAFLERWDPPLASRVALHIDPTPVFEANAIEAEIDKALHSRVWLPSGGYIVINQTEALVAIDVNTGRYVGRVRLEDTVLRTNLEAVKEIVRQLRLRDLGGILVVDFIDMEEAEHRVRVVAELEQELKRDRSKTKIQQISDFGLVEMTRKRVRPSLERVLCRPCASCRGSGRVKTPETVCYEIERELRKARRTFSDGTVEVAVHPDVAAWLASPERPLLGSFERDLGIRIEVRSNPALRVDQYELMPP